MTSESRTVNRKVGQTGQHKRMGGRRPTAHSNNPHATYR